MEPHLLLDHLTVVEKLATGFASSFDSIGFTSVAARTHDVGKYHPDFQSYIQEQNKKKGAVKHALPGAFLLSLEVKRLPHTHKNIGYLIGNIIAGHHRGLYDMNHSFLKRYDNLSDAEFPICAKELVAEQIKRLETVTPKKEWTDPLFCAALTRFSLSAVVDADWIDTEAYFNEERANKRISYTAPTFKEFQNRFQLYVSEFSQNELTEFRKKSELKGLTKGSFFELTLPTGYGKTFASLAFALNHAVEFQKSRIIVALPLINLTSELSETYRNIFDKENVIEDHSAFQVESYSELENQETTLYLATENYDRPFIITTTVQLFESLFNNRPSKLRKIHRLAGSIIILDEYHLIPTNVLSPILKMLDILQEYFGVTVLLVSATPIPLATSNPIEKLNLRYTPIPLLDEVATPRRVDYHHLSKVDEQTLMEYITEQTTLIIVNTRKHAQKMYSLMKSTFEDRKILHLSTTLTKKDRTQKLLDIKQLLEEKENIIVVSTSLLEAGVDISFQRVFREMAPLPSVIQAAGRCNRHGGDETGHVYLFEWENPTYPSAFYSSGIEQLRTLIDQNGMEVFYCKEAMTSYYQKMLSTREKSSLITDEEALFFENIAKKFKLIEPQGITVICPQTKGFRKEWLKEPRTRTWWRKIQPYTLQAPLSVQSKIVDENDLKVWKGHYDDEIGISLL